MSFIIHELRKHVRINITVPFGDTFRIVRTLWTVQSTQSVECKIGKLKRKYNVDLSEAVYNKRGNPTLYYNVHQTNPIKMSGKKGVGQSSALYATVMQDQSANELLNKGQYAIFMIFIGLLVIAIIGIGLYSNYQLGQKETEIIQLSKHYAELLANATRNNNGGIIIP